MGVRGINNGRIEHRNLLWISNLSGTGCWRCHAGIDGRNTCITSSSATAQESSLKKVYPFVGLLFPVRMLWQAGIELRHQLGFVVARVSAAEEAVEGFVEQARPRFFLAAGVDGVEERANVPGGVVVARGVADHQDS